MDISKDNQANQISSWILILRGEKVMFDFTLASMYQTETRALKQQVKRNKERFPEDFAFHLSKNEWNEVITNCDELLGQHKFTPRPPMVFTEQGVAMLSGVIRSRTAVLVNIEIMRAFVRMRRLIESNSELKRKIEKMESQYDEKFQAIFQAIRSLMDRENKPRKTVGFIIPKKL